ncbi:O-methyltransferase [Acidicapsa ligni]|uniref:O-methyltransferase n=1 Tax=Acidicapsa ligni TaxID=542300 RepID=UPI0021DFB354|nr:O-methyltransferase [Acidicapsa ligni]
MSRTKWAEVDSYLTDKLISPDPVLKATLAANATAGLPSIDVSPTQGKFLHMLATIQGAKRILEIGTLGGYSTTWLARALPPEGRLISLEFAAKHATVARENIAHAGLSEIVEIRIGPAAESLAQLHAEGTAPFDLIFIDADKPNNHTYLEWALKFSHKGTIILIDNVIRNGEISNAQSTDPNVTGTRAMFEIIAANPRLQATTLQTVGSKGYDGFTLAIVL